MNGSKGRVVSYCSGPLRVIICVFTDQTTFESSQLWKCTMGRRLDSMLHSLVSWAFLMQMRSLAILRCTCTWLVSPCTSNHTDCIALRFLFRCCFNINTHVYSPIGIFLNAIMYRRSKRGSRDSHNPHSPRL